MKKKRGGLISVSVMGLLILYLLLWPVSPKPVEIFIAPEAPSLTGQYQQNDSLQAVERLGDGYCRSPADLAIGADGHIYVGMGDGRIMRFETDGSNPELFVNTGGRPAGMAFDANRNMLVADTKLGLLSIAPNGAVTVLTTEADGRPIVLANDLDIATDGTVYFTDYRFYPDNVSDFLDGRPLTRLLAYDPRTQETRVVLDGLYAANGVALSPDESFVLVGEMTAYRVVRYWLSGPKQGQTDIFIENLPGFPDSIRFNGQDIYWLTLLAPRSSFKEFLQANPFWRGVLRRVPFLLEIAFSYPASSGFVLGLDRSGDVVYNLQDSSGKVASQISCACEYEGMLYLGSMSRTAIYRLPAP